METRDSNLYQLTLVNRERLKVNGVLEVVTFDEREIVASTKLGMLVIRGEGLHIIQLNLDEGSLSLEGEIGGLQYVENKKAKMKAKGKGVMERLFR